MFGSRFFFLKLLLGFGTFFGACTACYFLGMEINPSVRAAEVHAPRFDGETLWIPMAQVDAVSEEEFAVRINETRVRVRGRAEGIAPGDLVEITGTFHSRPATLDLHRVRKVAPQRRRIVEVVSMAVLAAVILLFFRRFRVRKGAWEFRWPTS
ncbi:MAG: hypothetical protein HYY17_02905 [Planctomycetes bacterium]|nr:hypothetical protein [Planctomycetota bacterium]